MMMTLIEVAAMTKGVIPAANENVATWLAKIGTPVDVVTPEVAPIYTVPLVGTIISILRLVRLEAPTRTATAVVLTVMAPLIMLDAIISAVGC